MLIAPVLDAVR